MIVAAGGMGNRDAVAVFIISGALRFIWATGWLDGKDPGTIKDQSI